MTAVKPSGVAVAGGGASAADAKASAAASSIPLSRVESLQDLDGSALREEWRRLYRTEPPRISRDLLTRALAYRLQELELGGLPKWARQSLAGSAAAAVPDDAGSGPRRRPAPPRLKPGARLVREWHGRTHTVIVLDDEFEFEGRRYRSLTQIACEITGAHWSGPRFFGLVKRNTGAGLDPASAHEVAPGGAFDQRASEAGAPTMVARDNAAADRLNPRGFGLRTKESAHG